MLTRGDDYPIHQTPEPLALAGSDRNFYDRYFFNGYAPDGSLFFAAALGVYPHLNIMDAAFSVSTDGVQRNLHASRILHSERLDTHAGPIAVDVVEPLHCLRIRIDDAEHGIRAELLFRARHQAQEEPRFTYRNGPRLVLDYTRMTQNGDWEGFIDIRGRRITLAPERHCGTRDRSWGIRPVGAGDPQPVAPPPEPQFYWIWCPLNFDDLCTFFHVNEDAAGHAWNTRAVVAPLGAGGAEEMARCAPQLLFRPGTRHARQAALRFETKEGRELSVTLDPVMQFYMTGLGYMNADWGHGLYKGEMATGYDEIDLSTVDEGAFEHLHIQALCRARLEGWAGGVREGAGVLEQLFIGPHGPSGFKGLIDPAEPRP
jgi:hypothetical protein